MGPYRSSGNHFRKEPMIYDGSLVYIKARAGIARRDGDRIEVTFADGSTIRVRDKDLELLHAGPVRKVPDPAPDGDFDTAWEMTAGQSTSIAGLADLTFGSAGPAECLACRQKADEGLPFRMDGDAVRSMTAEERTAEESKRKRKEGEAAERAVFIARARASKIEPGDERFWGEVEALALGRTQKSKTSAEIGAGETPESAQAWLLRTGLWTHRVNPHPVRSGHPTKAPDLQLGEDDDEGRIDLTGMQAWAIDNAWSHDPDDAISWDGSHIWVHVADPASVVVPDSPADLEAANRSGTLYLPEGAIPMLPDAALARFGLGLSDTSRALSFRMDIDDTGMITAVGVMPSFVKVTRTTYADADAVSGTGPLAELARLALVRYRYRQRNGAVDIDIPEVRVWLDDGVPMVSAVRRYRSSVVVREMMVLAGEGLARWAFERNLPFPYYSQEAPSTRETEKPVPDSLADSLADIDRGDTERLLAELCAPPESLAAEFARRRTMRAGMAGVQPRAHQGLGVTMYAQATSPLRRYGDLLGHQQVRAWLATEAGRPTRPPLPADELSMRLARAAAGNQAVRRAERQSELHWTLAWLMEHPAWEGDAIVVQPGDRDTGLYLPEPGLETRIRVRGLEADASLRVRFQKADLPSLEAQFVPVDAH